MPRKLPPIAKAYGLLMFRSLGPVVNRKRLAVFECRCGNVKTLRLDQVKSGKTKSCGCAWHPKTQGGKWAEEKYTYASWSGMIRRCEKKNSKWWSQYGARGVSVYFDWLGPGGFVNFLRDMGARPDNKTLDRYPDCAGNYGPDNCRWATAKEQRVNQRRMSESQPWTAKKFAKGKPVIIFRFLMGLVIFEAIVFFLGHWRDPEAKGGVFLFCWTQKLFMICAAIYLLKTIS